MKKKKKKKKEKRKRKKKRKKKKERKTKEMVWRSPAFSWKELADHTSFSYCPLETLQAVSDFSNPMSKVPSQKSP